MAPTSSTLTRTRATRIAVVAIVVAAVAAIVLGSQVGPPNASPPPTHPSQTPTPAPPSETAQPLPVGDPPRIPYIVHDTLYLGNRAQSGSFMEVQSAGSSAVAYRPGSSDLVTPVIFRDGRQVAVLSSAVGGTRPSPDGTLLAWFEVSGGTDHLVLRDLTSGADVARVSVDARALNPDFYGNLTAYGVANDGTVVYTTDAATYFAWHPGGSPVRVRAPHVRAAPDGFSSDASYVVLNGKGNWGVWVTDRLGHNPESPDSNGVTDGATFERRGDPQSRFTVTFPDGGGAYKVMWESDTDALLDYLIDGEGSGDRYLRCSVVTQRCEYAPTPANP